MLGDRTLAVSGWIDPTSDQVTLRPVQVFDVPARLPEPGDFTAELLDASGSIVAAYPFTPVRAQADYARAGSAFEIVGFHLALPYLDGAASVRIRRGEIILAAQDVYQ